jgi:hypothetical protein
LRWQGKHPAAFASCAIIFGKLACGFFAFFASERASAGNSFPRTFFGPLRTISLLTPETGQPFHFDLQRGQVHGHG